MSNYKFTKGKWEIKHSETKDAFNICGTLVGDKYKIARIPYLVTKSSMKLTEKDKTQAQYDAQLIAHAPEMLEMLEKCLSEFEQCKDAIWELMEYQDGWESNKDRVEEKIDKIENLIKKATEI